VTLAASHALRPGRPWRAAALGGTVALAVAGLAHARAAPEYSPAGTATAAAVAATAGVLLVATALYVPALARRSERALELAGVLWLLAPFGVPDVPAAAFSAALLTAGLAVPLAIVGGLPLTPRSAVATVAARVLLAAGLAGGAGAALLSRPAEEGCSACARNLVGLTSAPGTADGLARAGAWVTIGAAVVLVTALLIAAARATPPARTRTAAMTAAIVFAAGAAAGTAAGLLAHGDAVATPGASARWLAQAFALAAVAGAVVWGELRRRRRRDAIAALTARIASAPATGGLQPALAAALGDPTLRLGYPLAGDGGRLVDPAGEPTALAAGDGRERTLLTLDGRILAVAEHRVALLDDPALAGTLAEAAGLALEHEGLTAGLVATLRELRASRAHAVATTDAERRRLEQDLHDGAQQRLASLALHLEVAAGVAGRAGELERIRAAQGHLRGALEQLRALAHGLFPRALATDGLDAALEDLTEEAARPLACGGQAPPAPAPVAATAYALAAAVAAEPGGPVTITTGGGPESLEIAIAGARTLVGEALLDRVEALGGRLEQEPDGLRLELPCGS
jgi:signal transduction histidine kinase